MQGGAVVKQRILTLMLCFVVLITCTVTVGAESPKVIDETGMLTSVEMDALEKKAQALVDRYEMDVVLVMVNGLDGKTPEAYADDYFDYNGYGVGSAHSGVLFLLSLEDRDWYISTCGNAIEALTDYGIQSLFSRVSGFLASNLYYSAFDKYLDSLPIYFDAYEQGMPIDEYKDSAPSKAKSSPFSFINVILGLTAAGVTLWIMTTQMNTRKKQNSARDYVTPGSFQLSRNQDIFLHSTISKTRKQSSSGRSGGGGSSTHTSSSGRSHGGGGGKF